MKKQDAGIVSLTLALCTAATGPQFVALSLLMIDISETLGTPITVMGQLNTVFSVIAIIMSLAMGVLTVRFQPKKLLQTGIVTLFVGVVLAAVSPNYVTMMVSYVLYGVGLSLVIPIANLLIVLFPPEQRTSIMGRVYSGRSLTSIIATPVIGFLTAAFGWRMGFVGFGLPLIALTGLLVVLKIPKQPKQEQKEDITKGFKEIKANKSAAACLVGATLALAFFNSIMVYNGAYLRGILGFSIETASLIMSGLFIATAAGQVTSGAFARRFGVKKTTYLATFLCGVSFFAYLTVNLPVGFALVASVIGTAAAGTTMTALSSFALEQVAESKGTMMSLLSAGISFGGMLGSAIGGVAIDTVGFKGYGTIMFVMSLGAAYVLQRWTKAV
ncbi:MAG: MFS transporter [Candidatus Bathyarchaeota archaeon]|nr:MFS transporter [Candidatus Bathyarchaeota archaeon]